MNKLKTMALIASLIALYIGANAQTLTPQQNKKSKWGYVNEAGKAVIKHKYDNARAFSDGLAAVNKGGYWGLINEAGKEVLKCKYNEVRYFSEEGVAIVRSRINVSNGVYANKFGVVDKTGSFIVPLEYDTIRDFSNGLAVVKGEIANDWSGYSHKKYIRWGIIDKAGALVQPLKYTEISEFSDDLLKAEEEVNSYSYSRYHIIDKAGKIIATYTEIGEFSEGLAKVKSGNKWGCIDKTGKEIIPVEYKEISEFSDALLKAEEDDSYSYSRYHIIDKAGKIIAKYSWVGELSEGLARVKSGDKWGYIDKTGKVVIPVEYYSAKDFSEGFARVAKDNTGYSWGIIDKTGTSVLPFEYDEKKITSMSPSEFIQKEIKRKAEIETFTEEIEAVLDNDYYSKESPSYKVLGEVMKKLKTLIDDSSGKENEQLEKLYKELCYAARTKLMTEKHGVATAKKIMAGKYEIGMSKDASLESIAEYVPLSRYMFFGDNRFIIDAKLISQTKTSELWEVTDRDRGYKKMFWTFHNGKLAIISNY